MKYNKLQITGHVFMPNKKGKQIHFVNVICDCGTTKTVNLGNLKNGKIKSCGCLKVKNNREKLTTHGLTKHSLFGRWKNITQRCNNKNNAAHKSYGGRGIAICDEWKNDFKAFYDWCMANGYEKGLQIDRINNNGNYEPSNCRFVTAKENTRNSRQTKLDANQVFHIRLLCKQMPQKTVREMYGISASQISKIIQKQCWA